MNEENEQNEEFTVLTDEQLEATQGGKAPIDDDGSWEPPAVIRWRRRRAAPSSRR